MHHRTDFALSTHSLDVNPTLVANSHSILNQSIEPITPTDVSSRITQALADVSMKDPVCAGKIQQISQTYFSHHAILQAKKNWNRIQESLKQSQSPEPTFSESYWDNFQSNNSAGNRHKIDTLMSAFEKHFLSFLTEQNQKKFSLFSPLSNYLTQKNNQQDPIKSLLSELSYFGQLLLQNLTPENTALINTAITLFPPDDLSTSICVEGSRARLSDAILHIQRATITHTGLLSEITQSLNDQLEQTISENIVRHKLPSIIHPSFQIHLLTFLQYILGVDQKFIVEKDRFYLSPAKQTPAPVIYHMLTHATKEINESMKESQKNLIESYLDFYACIDQSDFSPKAFGDIQKHPFIELLKTFNSEFQLNSSEYIQLNEESSMPEWNKKKLFDEMNQLLNEHLFSEENSTGSLCYEDFFRSPPQETAKLLFSNNKKELESLVYFLYSISENFFSTSPVLFLSILVTAAKKKSQNMFSIEDIKKSANIILSQLQSQFHHPNESHLNQKVEKIIHRFDFLMRYPKDENKNYFYENTIKKMVSHHSFSSKEELCKELLKGLAPVALLKKWIPEKVLLAHPMQITKVDKSIYFHPEKLEVLAHIAPCLEENSLENLVSYALSAKDYSFIGELYNLAHRVFSYKSLKNIFMHLQTNDQIHEIQPFLQHLPANRTVKKDLLCQNLRNCHRHPSVFMTLIQKDEIPLLKMALQQLLHSSYNIEQINQMATGQPNKTLLEFALEQKKPEAFLLLLKSGLSRKTLCQGNAQTREHIFNLIAHHDDLTFLNILMNQGFTLTQILKPNGFGNHMVHTIAQHNCIHLLTELIEKGLKDIDDRLWMTENKSHMTPIHLAAFHNHPSILALLNDSFFALQQPNSLGKTAIQIAAEQGSREVLTYIATQTPLALNALREQDEKGNTLAHLAAEAGHFEIIKTLQELGITHDELLAPNNQGQTLSHMAALHGRSTFLRSLFEIENNIDFFNRSDINGYTPSILAARLKHTDVITAMLAIGVSLPSIMTPSPKGRKTVVHYAASKGDVQLLNALAAHGATSDMLNTKDKLRQTPSHIARKNQHGPFIKRLIELGVNTAPYTEPTAFWPEGLGMSDALLGINETNTNDGSPSPVFFGAGFGHMPFIG